jgi:integrase
MRRPYSLLCRKGIWYSRIYDNIGAKYLTAKSTGTRNRKEAERIALERVRVFRGDSFDSKISICNFCENFWDWTKSNYIQKKILLSPGSISKPYANYNRAHIRNYVRKYFDEKKLGELQVKDLDEFLLYLARKKDSLSGNTINKIMSALLQPLKEAYRLLLITFDPSRGSYRVGTKARVKGVFSKDEIRSLSNVSWDNEAAYLAFKLSSLTGMRLGEIRALKIEDVKSNQIVLQHSFSRTEGLKCPKNGKTRIVPIPPGLSGNLLRLAMKNPSGNSWVFWQSGSTSPIGDKLITSALYRAMKLIGIDEETREERNLSFHSLRHFFNTTMRGHVSEDDLRATMGHSSSAMTDYYDHLSRFNETPFREAQSTEIMSLFSQRA